MPLVTIYISEQKIKDLLCSAFEGGSNYWYWIESFNYPDGQTKESLELEFPQIELPLIENGSLTIKDTEDEGLTAILDRKSLYRGLQTMADIEPYHFADILSDNDDSDTGDIYLQCCLFGKVIFG